MWETYLFYTLLALAVIVLILTARFWGDALYLVSHHWRAAMGITIACLCAALLVVKQEELKYELAYYHFAGTKNTDTIEARYQLRQCKEFVQAKLANQSAQDDHYITAGIFKVSSVSNWEFCARTFGLNYWKHDTSINGQDGGHLLCDVYARDTYRSAKVNAWCDTVFAPDAPEDVGI